MTNIYPNIVLYHPWRTMCWISPGKLCVAASLGKYVLRHPWELCLAYEKERMQKYKRLYVGVYLYIQASISIHVFV